MCKAGCCERCFVWNRWMILEDEHTLVIEKSAEGDGWNKSAQV